MNANGGKPILTGADLEPKLQRRTLGQNGRPRRLPGVQCQRHRGVRRVHDEHTGEIIGIVLDDSVHCPRPYIKEPILDGQAQISGGFANLNEAQSLANLLNAGVAADPAGAGADAERGSQPGRRRGHARA